MIGRPEYTLSLPPPCPTNRDHLTSRADHGRLDSRLRRPFPTDTPSPILRTLLVGHRVRDAVFAIQHRPSARPLFLSLATSLPGMYPTVVSQTPTSDGRHSRRAGHEHRFPAANPRNRRVQTGAQTQLPTPQRPTTSSPPNGVPYTRFSHPNGPLRLNFLQKAIQQIAKFRVIPGWVIFDTLKISIAP